MSRHFSFTPKEPQMQVDLHKIQTFCHARYGEWAVKYYPSEGGLETYRLIRGIGWVVDANNEMPHDIFRGLCEALDAPQIDIDAETDF